MIKTPDQNKIPEQKRPHNYLILFLVQARSYLAVIL